ncbi:MAG: hypothetical protein WC943_05740 [Elusimicrobiota bacterium]
MRRSAARSDGVIRIEIGRKTAGGLLAAVLLLCAYAAVSETLTMTSYYPSPAGVYQRLITTARTVLARDGDRVGVGTTNPQARLDVAGAVRMGSEAFCGAANAGAQRYNSVAKKMEFCDGSAWMPFDTVQGNPVLMYRCPVVVGGALGGGQWGFYGCMGQISSTPNCTTIEFPNQRVDNCVYAGRMLLLP